MTRRTLDRNWTDAERRLAEKICDAVAAGCGNIVGTAQIARYVGLSISLNKRERSVRKVMDVMPLAVIIAPDRYPGQALLVHPRTHVYSMTENELDSKRTATTRLKKLHTSMRRVASEVEPLRGRDDLGSLTAVKLVEMGMSALDPEMWNAILVEVGKNDGDAA